MSTVKGCVYCGLSAPLSESDIVPDALTNTKLLFKNVCQIEHNNRFSDLFESEIINKLSIITNALDIKSSKAKKYPAFDVTLKHEGQEYSVHVSSDNDLSKIPVIPSTDRKSYIGTPQQLEKISKDPSLIRLFQRSDIEYSATINLDVFFCPAMYRLISKIAFEWYCSKANIDNYCPDFADIVNFITTGNGNNPVKVITEPGVYEHFNELASMGSHCLMLYKDLSCRQICVISLFGIAIYYVEFPEKMNKYDGISFVELRTDSQKKDTNFDSIKDAKETVNEIFVEAAPGMMVLKNPTDQQHIFKSHVLCLHDILLRFGVEELTEKNKKDIIKIMKNSIHEILNAELIHRRGLRRFVDENIPLKITKDDEINIDALEARRLLNTFFVYCVGQSEMNSFNEEQLKSLIRIALSMDEANEVHLNKETDESIRNLILSDDKYREKIIHGAELIRKW